MTKVLAYCFVPAVRFKSVVMNQHNAQQIKVTRSHLPLQVLTVGLPSKNIHYYLFKNYVFITSHNRIPHGNLLQLLSQHQILRTNVIIHYSTPAKLH